MKTFNNRNIRDKNWPSQDDCTKKKDQKTEMELPRNNTEKNLIDFETTKQGT